MTRDNRQINRRVLLRRTARGAVALGAAHGFAPWTNAAEPTAGDGPPYPNEAAAVEKGRRLDIGSAVLEGPAEAVVRSYGTWTLVYSAGNAGVKPGGGIRVGLRHMVPVWSKVQGNDPKEDGYVTAAGPEGVALTTRVECTNWSREFFNDYFPFQNIVEAIVGGPGLKPGQTIRITYGDRSGGSKGLLLQPFDEPKFAFRTFVDAAANGDFLPLSPVGEEETTIRIKPGPAVRLSVVTPSQATASEPTHCIVRAEDEHGNPADGFRGTVRLSSTEDVKLPEPRSFGPDDRGVKCLDGIVSKTQGVVALVAEDGRVRAQSNPVRVGPPKCRVLWGDLHGHTIFSDGRGTVEEYLDFARNVAGLDFCAVSDHAFEITDAMWAHSKEVTNRFNDPGRFVTFHGYEWSGTSDVGGDHNVYWLDDDPPIYRSTSYYSPKNLQMAHDEASKKRHITDLFAALRGHLHDKNVLVIPHRGGRAGNPKWHDPKLQRLVECYCEHVRSQQWAEAFLKAGHRVGLMGSGDDHYGNPGYGYLKPPRKQLVGEGLVAVWAESHSRRGIFEALYDRRCYATTGARIMLDFKLDGHPMGSEIQAEASATLSVYAFGEERIELVQVLKNSRVVYEHKPKLIADFQWRDPDFYPERSCYYHVHVVQQDGEEALSSPIWVN